LTEILADYAGTAISFATTAEERNRLWRARHQMHYALLAQRPGAKAWGTDVCVPISALPRCIARIAADIEAAPFPISLLGHVGDGNFHLGLLIDPSDSREMAIATELNDKVVASALALDGTSTGEHGVGHGKAKFMFAEHGEGLEMMWAIKRALDPQGILNPGKIFPAERFEYSQRNGGRSDGEDDGQRSRQRTGA
jgi:D-lactate dehydrogenase (cytochrome)